jgi:hypothetical protein
LKPSLYVAITAHAERTRAGDPLAEATHGSLLLSRPDDQAANLQLDRLKLSPDFRIPSFDPPTIGFDETLQICGFNPASLPGLGKGQPLSRAQSEEIQHSQIFASDAGVGCP